MEIERQITPKDDPEVRYCPVCGDPMEFDGVQWECVYCGHKESDEPEPQSYND